MNPLDATSPRELFGDTIQDARALKRAYAKLIRQYPPETSPEAFTHIRALYEHARQALSQAPSPETKPESSQDPLDALDAIFARHDPSRWYHWLSEILQELDRGNLHAIQAGYGLLMAREPHRAFDWLRLQLDRPGARPLILECIGCTIALLGDRTRDPAFDTLLDALPPADARPLRAERLRVLAPFHPLRAAEIWVRDLDRIAASPELAQSVLVEVPIYVRWYLDDDDLRAVLDLAEDARLELNDDHHLNLRELIYTALAARAYDGPSALTLRRVLQEGHRSGALSTLAALLELRRELDEPEVWLQNLARDAPTLYAALTDMIMGVSELTGYLGAWVSAGRPPAAPEREHRWLDECGREFERLRLSEPAGSPEAEPPSLELRKPGLWLLALAPALLLVLLLPFLGLGVTLGVLYQLVVSSLAAWREYQTELRLHEVLAEDERMKRVMSRALVSLARQGYWPHEVVAAAHLLYGPETWHPLSPLFTSADATFALLDEAHLRRLHTCAILEASRQHEAADSNHLTPPEEPPP
ncbi:MAG: hypothetical protein EA397_19840 [Deltaproteobacteria bacterium]|nr:MAG: hypothetical protein EA397_19840 [Deltaproteobacteria bacterium]